MSYARWFSFVAAAIVGVSASLVTQSASAQFGTTTGNRTTTGTTGGLAGSTGAGGLTGGTTGGTTGTSAAFGGRTRSTGAALSASDFRSASGNAMLQSTFGIAPGAGGMGMGMGGMGMNGLGMGGMGMGGMGRGIGGFGNNQFGNNQFGMQNNRNGQQGGKPNLRIPMRVDFDVPIVPAVVAATRIQAFENRLPKFPGLKGVEGITMTADGQTAILRGSVKTQKQKELVERLVMFEPGVIKVQNDIKVEPSPN